LHPECVEKNPDPTKGKTEDDYCSFCYTEGLSQAPSVQIKCGHIFHLHCILERIKKRWPGPRIVFGFLDCTECKSKIEAPHCPALHQELSECFKIEVEVIKKSIERAKFEGIDKDPRLNDKADPYYNNVQKWALFKLAYYQCFKCKTAYFGGMKDCIRAQEEG
jgi:E3 ubiquitin-protein ligase MYCBP2